MKNQRFQFLILTIIIFIVGFFLFGILGIIISLNNASTYVTDNPFLCWLFLSFGWLLFFQHIVRTIFYSKMAFQEIFCN